MTEAGESVPGRKPMTLLELLDRLPKVENLEPCLVLRPVEGMWIVKVENIEIRKSGRWGYFAGITAAAALELLAIRMRGQDIRPRVGPRKKKMRWTRVPVDLWGGV